MDGALQTAIDDVELAARGLLGELDAMIARRERALPTDDAAAQVAAAARSLPAMRHDGRSARFERRRP